MQPDSSRPDARQLHELGHGDRNASMVPLDKALSHCDNRAGLHAKEPGWLDEALDVFDRYPSVKAIMG